MERISRAEAHAKGLKHFYTGKPCRRGHDRERNVTTGACLGCLAHYAAEYSARFKADRRAQAMGSVAHTVQVDPTHISTVEAFVALLNRAKTLGTEVPLVPALEHVASVNTMIRMMAPATPSAPPPPPAAAAAAATPSAPVVDPRHAMWVRIHGQEVADQMVANGMLK